jgi:hypothetical protein
MLTNLKSLFCRQVVDVRFQFAERQNAAQDAERQQQQPRWH